MDVRRGISEYALQVIREVIGELKQNDRGEWTISNKYFKDWQSDTFNTFSNYKAAKTFIIDEILKDLNY